VQLPPGPDRERGQRPPGHSRLFWSGVGPASAPIGLPGAIPPHGQHQAHDGADDGDPDGGLALELEEVDVVRRERGEEVLAKPGERRGHLTDCIGHLVVAPEDRDQDPDAGDGADREADGRGEFDVEQLDFRDRDDHECGDSSPDCGEQSPECHAPTRLRKEASFLGSVGARNWYWPAQVR